MKILQMYRKFREWKIRVWNKENTFSVPFFIRLKYGIKGFTANEYVWYDLAVNDYRNYISDYERIKSRNINGDFKLILDDKLLFEEIFRNYIKVPNIYAWVSDGNVYGMHGNHLNNKGVLDFLRKKKEAVLKWERGYEGRGTYIIKVDSSNKFWINGKLKDDAYVQKIFEKRGEAILCEYMHQSDFANELYPNSTNTIRIICAKKKGEYKTHVVKAAQRIGNQDSAPIDNVSAGAIACEIDIEKGELFPGVIAKNHQKDLSNKFLDYHPETGVQLSGKKIPGWKKIVFEIEKLTNSFPYLNFVAWDVLLLDDGFCLIEGNASSGCMMFQQRHGVKNEEIGDIYRSYGVKI